ncbi:MAG: shikimate dehydrogenase [Actinomycetota bacterium]|nr:shikimate dehydrogenase [Actinomycetota bacterium]
MTKQVQGLLGVLGWPLTYTLSPELHTAAFRAANLDWVYLAWPVPPEALGDAIAGLRALGAIGVNLTMPHKSTVLELLDDLGGDAEAVGAVNTLQFTGGRVIGHNTDIEGFSRFLSGDAGFDADGRRALVVGAGGAARAVVRALDQLGASEVTVAARDIARAEEVASLSEGGRPLAWSDAPAAVPEVDVIVNATPLGTGDEDALPGASFGPDQTVVDLIYSPASTPLIEHARAAGAAAWGGLGMLIHQAGAAFRIWTGQPPPLETMSAAALRATGLHRHLETQSLDL